LHVAECHCFVFCRHYYIATSLQNEVTRLKSVAAAPAVEDIGNSEEDRQNLIQVIEMSQM
jgi:hypothetical protein